MRFLRNLLIGLVGLLANLAGLAGSSDQVAAWAHWLGTLHAWLENPAIWLTSTLVGTGLMAYAWADYLSEQAVAKAGGISKREFSAHLSHWDRVKLFPVWQVAWLWNDLEPQAADTSGTVAYPTFRRLKEDLAAGLIKDAQREKDSWKDTMLNRQQLTDYAFAIDERPKFLFPRNRTWHERLVDRLFRETYLSKEKVHEYQNIYHWYSAGRSVNPPMDLPQVRQWVSEQLKAGKMEAIGRPRVNGIDCPTSKYRDGIGSF